LLCSCPVLIPAPVSTNDILALSFGIASTIIGVATAFITYIKRAPKGRSLASSLLSAGFEANLWTAQQDVERQATTNGGRSPTTHISTPTTLAINDGHTTHDLQIFLSFYNNIIEEAGIFYFSETIDRDPLSYSNIPSPVTVTGIKARTIETLSKCFHGDTTTHDTETSLSTNNKSGIVYFVALSSKGPRSVQGIEA
jgi:hypothetical protein